MREIQPTDPFPDIRITDDAVFLAGSIEQDTAERWQSRVVRELSGIDDLIILNPRRDDWDATWVQQAGAEPFTSQVEWELRAMREADIILMYFSPGTMSPITLLELGLHANSGKLIVVCPEGFWRKGNVDIVCARYDIEQQPTLEAAIERIRDEIDW